VNYRLTITTAVAVILASVSLYPLISGIAWFWAGCGAVVIAALAGLATRLPPLPAACVAAGLALIAAFPLLASPHPYLGVTGLVIVAAAAASVTGWGPLPAAATLITYLASQLIYINLLFAPGASNGGVIPTTASLRRLGTLVSQGVGERIYAPPVPDRAGVVMLAAAGIGLMAVAADLIAVRMRSPAIAGLPLLVLFSVPITTSAKQGPVGATIAFCLAITGYLAVLSADGRDRLRIWGRLVTLWQTGKDGEEQVRGPDTRALAASGRRIGLAAVCVAIFIPLLIPGIKIHKLFNGHGSATGGGGSHAVTLPSPLVELRGQLLPGKHIPVLTYSTNSADPFDQYLQVYVLNFDPKSGAWVLAPSSGGVPVTRASLPPPPGLAGSGVRSFTTHIKLASGLTGYTGGVSYLPVPYAPTKVTVDGSWSADASTLMISSLDRPLAGLSYSATIQEVLPTSEGLDAAGPPPADVLRQYGLFPATSDSPLHKLAQRITKHASSLYGKAMAIQDWFTKPGRFIYTTSASQPNTLAGLLRFLTTARQGYCQQFAFGMAAGPADRDPGAGRGGLHRGHPEERRQLAGHLGGRARLARAVLPGRGLAAVRAHPRRFHRPGHRVPAGLCPVREQHDPRQRPRPDLARRLDREHPRRVTRGPARQRSPAGPRRGDGHRGAAGAPHLGPGAPDRRGGAGDPGPAAAHGPVGQPVAALAVGPRPGRGRACGLAGAAG